MDINKTHTMLKLQNVLIDHIEAGIRKNSHAPLRNKRILEKLWAEHERLKADQLKLLEQYRQSQQAA